MKHIILLITAIVLLWLAYGVYRSVIDRPEVIWEGDEIVSIENCARPNQGYNTSCSYIRCEYELRRKEDLGEFIELKVIRSTSVGSRPGYSRQLVEVVNDSGEQYFLCETDRDLVEKIEKTSIDEFEQKNDL